MKRFLVFIILFGLFACRQVNKNESGQESRDAFMARTPQSQEVIPQKIYYRFPSPNEIIDYINSEDLDYISSHPNDIENAGRYVSSADIALNLGVYIADLVYITLFKNLKQASEYFETVEQMADQLRLSAVFTDKLKSRIQNNLNNVDSLNLIAKDAYNSMVNMMIAQGDEETLTIISAGAYIESLYLILHQVTDYKGNEMMIQKIFEQKYAFENLLKYMSVYQENDHVRSLYKKLNEISMILGKAEVEQPAQQTNVTRGSGGLVFSGGGYSLEVSRENYFELKSAIEQIRSSFISI